MGNTQLAVDAPAGPERRRPAASARKKIAANSVARALVLIGDRWSLLIIGSAFLGVQRFSDWRAAIGVSPNILSGRLARLVASGCLARVTAEGGARENYRLTRMGTDLFATALMFWRFNRNWSAPSTRVAILTHTGCGHEMNPRLVCRHCAGELQARDVRYADGPGMRMESSPPPKSSRRSTEKLDNGTLIAALYGEALDHFGDRFTQLVMASFFLGDRRFEDIRLRWQLAPNVLADRLKLLVETGMLQRRVYDSTYERREYLLTPKGMDVYPIVLALNAWGDRWLAGRKGPPLVLTHLPCGAPLQAMVACDGCAQEVSPHTVRFALQGPEPVAT